ncbi:MAG: lysophospholipase [Bacteroidales bacterium]|nr:lysophospholipase [Bacteroidales bacterium]MBP5522223.1 lysophospholipase [Bacteroidales bacterium]
MQTTTIPSPKGDIQISLIYSVPESAPKGIVQIAHGMCEHKERYIPLMEFLSANGYVAVCNDHRGHGASVLSKDDLGYMGKDGWLALVNDLKAVTDWAKAQWPSLPFNLFGHSMGSLAVRSYAHRYDSALDSLIVCGCPSDNPAKGAGIMLAKLIGKVKGWHYRPMVLQKMSFGAYNKPFASEGWPAAWVCSDPDVLKAYHADPLCQFVFTADGFLNLLLLMKDCYDPSAKVANPGLPVHFISGSEDPCRVSDKALDGAVQAMRDLGYAKVTLKVYPGMRHEIHNETGRAEVWNDILSYLKTTA